MPNVYRSAMFARTRRWLPWLALAAVVIGFANFIWFFAESSTIGDAQRGYVRDGRYYLMHRGIPTEVSKEQWDWSRLHSASVLLTHPLALAGGAYLMLTVILPSVLATGDPNAQRERVERIRSSGAALASTRTGGRIGELHATKPLVRVNVHPGGLIITVIGGTSIGIESDLLTDLTPERSFGTKVVRISHRQIDAPIDVRLYLDEASPVVQALRGLMPAQPEVQPTGDIPERRSAAIPTPYPVPMKAAIIVGMGLSIVFLIVALLFGRNLGGVGMLLPIVLVLIFAYNFWTYCIRNRRRW